MEKVFIIFEERRWMLTEGNQNKEEISGSKINDVRSECTVYYPAEYDRCF